MGKAEIISHLGDGQYSVKLLRDQTWLDGRIVWLAGRITALQAERVPLAEALAAAVAEFEAAETVIEQLQKNIAVSIARVDLARIDAAITAAQKRKTQLESAVSTLAADTRSVWCADLTTTLSGEYPTAEVNGTSDHAILMPGTMPTEYTGDLAPVISMTVAQATFNFAIHPGWQRWTPTFRLATITALSVAQDTCSVTLATAKDRYQSLGINASETLDNVPISYMTCDAKAFSVGDEVLIMFQGQDWATPAVIGFKENPKPCLGNLVLVVASKSGAEAIAYNIATGEIIVEKADFDAVVAAIETLGFNTMGQQQLTTFETVTVNFENDMSQVDTVPGPFNMPDFYLGENYDNFLNYGLVSANAVITERQGISDLAIKAGHYEHSIIRNPETQEVKARYYMRWGYASGGNFTELLYNHCIFDREEPANWTRPTEAEGVISTDIHVFSQQYMMHTYAGETVRWGADSGIAANVSGSVIFENVGICRNTSEDFTTCLSNYSRHLQIWAAVNPDLPALETQAMALIDFERTNRGLTPYKWNHALGLACNRHAQDMATFLFYGHTGSDFSTEAERVQDAGYSAYEVLSDPGETGECVAATLEGVYPEEWLPSYPEIYYAVMAQPEYAAAGHAENAVALWLSSDIGHREILLDANYTDAAISARLGSDGMYYWCFVAGDFKTIWPGYAPIPSLPITDYMDANFTFAGEGDSTRMLDLYLI